MRTDPSTVSIGDVTASITGTDATGSPVVTRVTVLVPNEVQPSDRMAWVMFYLRSFFELTQAVTDVAQYETKPFATRTAYVFS